MSLSYWPGSLCGDGPGVSLARGGGQHGSGVGLQAGCVLWSSLIPIFPATLLPVAFLSLPWEAHAF